MSNNQFPKFDIWYWDFYQTLEIRYQIFIRYIQNSLYNAGVNPKITSLTVTISKNGSKYKTEYTAIVDRSSDGKAWMGFGTKGSCGVATCEDGRTLDYITRADGQYNGTTDTCIVAATSPCYGKSMEQCFKDSATTKAVDWDLILTYQNTALQFKQYFVQFTKSDKPAK